MENLESIPKLPGCYIFKNKLGQIIYIGKSKCLYNRVRQYFSNLKAVEASRPRAFSNSRSGGTADDGYNKYIELAKEVRSIETIVTDSETDALILECKLIKTYKPKYNSQLKQSGAYPFIRISEADSIKGQGRPSDKGYTYPVISIVNSIENDSAKYYGSFYDKYDALKTIELIGNIWRTPTCGKPGGKPCLNYHIGKCCAPCGGMIDPPEYQRKINEIKKCLGGDFKQTRRRLGNEMVASSTELDFETAARIRDGLAGLDRLEARQKRLCTDLKNKSVYLFFHAFNEPKCALFFIKDSVTLNRADFSQPPGEEALRIFIEENKNEKAPVGDGAFLTRCLLDIGAGKLFVPVAKNAGTAQTVRKLLLAYREFMPNDPS